MNISEKLCEALRNCNYFSRCGLSDLYDFEVEFVNYNDALALINNSFEWENLCLKISGDFTEFLSKNYRKEFREWNAFVRNAKQTIMMDIEERITSNWKYDNNKKAIIDNACFTILTSLLLDYYAEFYTSEFYNNLLTVYLSGHYPCGWNGKYPNGKLLVY